jgi:hypothetical protein
MGAWGEEKRHTERYCTTVNFLRVHNRTVGSVGDNELLTDVPCRAWAGRDHAPRRSEALAFSILGLKHHGLLARTIELGVEFEVKKRVLGSFARLRRTC